MFKFKWEKGDRDNPKGKAIIYSVYDPKPNVPIDDEFEPGQHCFVYVSKDLEDIAVFTKQTMEELRRKLDRSYGIFPEESENQDLQLLEEDIEDDDEIVCFPATYCTDAIMATKEEILDRICGDEDIVFVDAFSDPDIYFDSAMEGARLYSMKYQEYLTEQEADDLKTFSEDFYNSILTTHNHFQEKDIKEYVWQIFVSPMIKAKEIAHNEQIKELEKDFKRFSKDSRFENEVNSLCRTLNYGLGSPNSDVIETLIDKINAIHTEQYEQAEELKNKLARLIP